MAVSAVLLVLTPAATMAELEGVIVAVTLPTLVGASGSIGNATSRALLSSRWCLRWLYVFVLVLCLMLFTLMAFDIPVVLWRLSFLSLAI